MAVGLTQHAKAVETVKFRLQAWSWYSADDVLDVSVELNREQLRKDGKYHFLDQEIVDQLEAWLIGESDTENRLHGTHNLETISRAPGTSLVSLL